MPASRLMLRPSARAAARPSAPSSSSKGTGAKVRNSITAARAQAAAAEEQQQRARRAAEAQRQRRVQPVGHAEPRQQVGEERRVGLGPRQDDAHLLERDAARGLAQQPPHDRAHLGRLAGRGQQLDASRRRTAGSPAAARRALAQARERRRRGRAARAAASGVSARRPRRHAVLGGPGRGTTYGAATAGSGRRSRRTGNARGERRHELDLAGVQLEVVDDQHVRARRASARAPRPLARRGQQRRGVGEAALERSVERAVEPARAPQAARVVGRRAVASASAATRGGRDPRAAQRRRASARAPRHRRARQSVGEREARAAGLRPAGARPAARRGRSSRAARPRPSSAGSASARASSSTLNA